MEANQAVIFCTFCCCSSQVLHAGNASRNSHTLHYGVLTEKGMGSARTRTQPHTRARALAE